ncbi:MAG: PepSY-associated TM helix domain-containing protein [Verrucomicrobia bacterium]|nr:PepSY-associated TM helix domain-containing protein [Verrucomicrobiota bacterium]
MTRFYPATRDLHLYVGLFLSPFILLFAISTLVLNHPPAPGSGAVDAGATPKKTVPIEVPPEPGTLGQARQILDQLRVTGEIDYVHHNAKAGRLTIPVTKPGETARVEVDLRAKSATVERQAPGLGAALVYLHKMPGPHNASVRGNWVYMVWWKIAADAVVYGTLFLTVSGLYLWWVLRAERRIGWALLGAGIFSVVALVGAIVTA